METNQSKRIVHGALILTLAGLISKVLSAGYRIPLQNLTGDIGFYLYQQIYPIIGIVMILSLYGFPVAVSKLTVELEQSGKQLAYRTFYIPLFMILLLINSVIFISLYFFAPMLANLVGDVRLSNAFQVVALAFLLIAPLAIFRGVSQGRSEMKQTALSQVAEQIVRVVIIISAAVMIYKGKLPIEKIAEIGGAATVISMFFAIIVLMLLGPRKAKKPHRSTAKLSIFYLARTCISVGMVAALVHMIILIIQFADVLTFVPEMIVFGSNQIEAMVAKGIFDRGQPLIQFGVVIGSSFSLALIPNVISKKANLSAITSAISLSFYIAAGATIGLIVLFSEVNLLLFKSTAGTGSLQILMLATLLSSLTITASAILQGLGKVNLIALSVVATFFIKIMLNKLLIPLLGMSGAAIATVCALFLLLLVITWLIKYNLRSLNVLGGVKWRVFFIASAGMIVYLRLIKYVINFTEIPSRTGLLVYVSLLVVTGALVYLSLLLRYRAFTEVQLATLPFSGALIGLQDYLGKKERE